MWCVLFRDKLNDAIEVVECGSKEGAENLYSDMKEHQDITNVTLVLLDES